MLKLAIFKTSRKENERRIPIYPEHVFRLDEQLRRSCFFEEGYANDYGRSDALFATSAGGVLSRAELFQRCDVMVLPKPAVADLLLMREGQILCGWAHCVQQRDITQAAVERGITVLAWESMNCWDESGRKLMHSFYRNNELAGYAAILHSLQLLGIDGHYGPRRRVAIMGFGSVSKGAIYALQGRGFNNIHVFTRRPTHLVGDQNPDVYYGHYFRNNDGQIMARDSDGQSRPLIDELAQSEIICNGILQDTDQPTLFVSEAETSRLKPGSVIVDISCDQGMGFSFARPTSFEKPMFEVGDNIYYYSVDHTPTYLWNAASREISRALIPYLSLIASGREAWESEPTVFRAMEIERGHIRNPKILNFQNRSAVYPHLIHTSSLLK